MGGLRIVAGRWGRRRLKAPRGRSARPTAERVREAWMSVLGADLDGARVVDLFAGSGALGLEALSRGAGHATFVERERRALACLEANLAALDAGALATVVRRDVFGFIDDLGPGSFDIALADPPYGEGSADRLVRCYHARPFAKILSVEYGVGEPIQLPTGAEERRYGDTVIAFMNADVEEEGI